MGVELKSPSRSNKRRRSPSVNMPLTWFSSLTTAVMPSFLAVISNTASRTNAVSATDGISAPACMMSNTRNNSRRPSLPPGCDRAKSSRVKPRASNKATAKASPMTNAAVVLDVGAKPNVQASSRTPMWMWTSACRASVEAGFPVMPTKAAPMRLMTGKIVNISAFSPELDKAMTTSFEVIIPKSPWLASPGWTKKAGVPVLARVAAILPPIWPDFPMPVTTILPGQSCINRQAATKLASMRPARAATASASIRTTFRPIRSNSLSFMFEVIRGGSRRIVIYGNHYATNFKY